MAETLLLIDPDSTYADALLHYLGRHGIEIHTASGIAEAERLFTETGPAIILCDPELPDGDGVAMLQSFLSRTPPPVLIIMAAPENLESFAEIFSSRAIHYLNKPIKSTFLDLALEAAQDAIRCEAQRSEDKRRMAEIEDVRALYKELFDEVPCYISVQDRNFRLTATNRLFKRDFGSDVGEYCYRVYKHRDSPCPECPVGKTFEDGRRYETEEVVTSRSGRKYHVLTQTAGIRDASGQISQVMEIATNITQIRELQDHLSSLGMMIGSVSHGVKGMLTALDGGLYQLETGISKNDFKRVKTAYDRIGNVSGMIRRTVLDILFYVKARKMRYESVDAAAYFRMIGDIIHTSARKGRVAFKDEIPDNLGIIELDATWMQQALLNLGDNAVDACNADAEKEDHRIEYRIRSQSRHSIELVIRDNGTGIDTETREKLFTLFFTSKGSKGTGLGLFIAHHVIRHHQGSIQVVSEPGKGTDFIVTLPRSQGSA